MTPNFTCSQNYGDIETLTIEDTSTSPDPAVTGRLIYVQKYNGDYLVPNDYTTDYIFWPAASTTFDIENMLDKDYCVLITVYWYVGSSIGYSKQILTLFTAYSELFLRQLTQAQEANNKLLNSVNFWNNKIKLRTLVDDASQAVASLNDQTIAQFALDEAKKLTDNSQTFFN